MGKAKGKGRGEKGTGGGEMGFSFTQPYFPIHGFSVIDFALQWMRLLRARLNDFEVFDGLTFVIGALYVPGFQFFFLGFAQERIINLSIF